MTIIRDWNEFWFTEKSPAPLGIFRVCFGFACIFWGLLMAPPILYTWFSEEGVVPLSFYNLTKGSTIQISLLNSVTDDRVLLGFWLIYLVVALMFTIGLYTRFSTILLFALFVSFNARSPLVLNSGDTMIRCVLFLLLFAPSDLSCSVDRMIAISRGVDPGGEPAVVELWSQRMIQVQISLVYVATVVSKLSGHAWLNGTAVYYPLHMAELTRFPVPEFFSQDWVINILTWGTLAVETSLGILVWFRRTRGYVLSLGVLLHCSIEYALNIPLFSLIMITSYLNFTYNEWISEFVSTLSRSFSRYSLTVQLPYGVTSANTWWLVVERLDCLHLLSISSSNNPDNVQLCVFGRGWEATGARALRRIILAFPACWVAAPFLFVPGTETLLKRFLPSPEMQPSIISGVAV